MQIAVTGASGELGSALVPLLLAAGHAVVSIDQRPPASPGDDMSGNVRHLTADVTDYGQFVGALRGCEALIHLAAIRTPFAHPDHTVYTVNSVGSYNALSAASLLGITRVCLASSINAIGGAFSRRPRYDYFPLDEAHPTYAEDAYSLSKWVLEQQGEAFARRFPLMTISSLRFHWLLERAQTAKEHTAEQLFAQHQLWGYTELQAAARACMLSLLAAYQGHEVFYIVASQTAAREPSLALARRYFPEVAIRGDLSGHAGFFSTAKAERLLGWQHDV